MGKLAMGPEDELVVSGAGGSGPLMAYNRRRRGLDIFQVINADQHWTFEDVVRLEGEAVIAPADIARYMRALDAAERERGD